MNTITLDQETLKRIIEKAVADEREACAQVCEALAEMNKGVYGEMQIAVHSAVKSIRARGNT